MTEMGAVCFTPPRRHQSDEPRMLARKVFQEDRRVQHQVSTGAERTKACEQPEHDPVRGCASDDREDGRDKQRDVECEPTADHVGRESPEQSADQHSDVDSDCQAGVKARLELECRLC